MNAFHRSIRASFILLVLASCAVALPASWNLAAAQDQQASTSQEADDSAQTTGYKCVFLGHSFFAPIARQLEQHPARCGFEDHEQFVVFHGGANGSPGRLWASDREDVVRAKEQIQTGEIDLVGLTFYPAVGSDVEDYKKWIDLARESNPNTRFFIMAPWPTYRGKTFAEYESQWDEYHPVIHELIAELSDDYPDTEIFCIPQGKWMVELWRLFESGDLPEVTSLMREEGQGTRSCLFTDSLGHGGRIPIQVGALLWLAAIYETDVREYEWDTGIETDLKTLAWSIINEHQESHALSTSRD